MLIHAQHIQKTFKQEALSNQVLRDVSASFEQGKGYIITGHSGSGKSTLMHILAGLDTPDGGQVLYDNQDIHTLSPTERSTFLHKTIGLVFQLPYLIQELSVIENVMVKGLIAGLPHNTSKQEALSLLELVGIPEKATAQPASLSGGQQQRVALARALFNKPAFLLADEPTGNLDEKTSKSIIDLLIKSKNDWNMGLIICSHDLSIVDQLDAHYDLKNGFLQKMEL